MIVVRAAKHLKTQSPRVLFESRFLYSRYMLFETKINNIDQISDQSTADPYSLGTKKLFNVCWVVLGGALLIVMTGELL